MKNILYLLRNGDLIFLQNKKLLIEWGKFLLIDGQLCVELVPQI